MGCAIGMQVVSFHPDGRGGERWKRSFGARHYASTIRAGRRETLPIEWIGPFDLFDTIVASSEHTRVTGVSTLGNDAMHPRQLVLAAVMVLGCTGGAAAFPVLSDLGVTSAFEQRDIDQIRWRYRYRRDIWRYLRGVDRSDVNGLGNGARLMAPEDLRSSPRRRRGWVDPPPLR